MNGLITADNLPVIIGIVLSANVLYFIREMVIAVQTWRKGASERARDLLMETLAQLERCHNDRDKAQTERDTYLRQVGRRDYILLAHGIEPPTELPHGFDVNRNAGPAKET